MKKLFVLMLVLGVASAANAMTLTLVNGDADTVDIDCLDGYVVGDDTYFALVGDTGKVAVSGGAVVAGVAPTDSAIYGYDAQLNGLSVAPEDGMWGFLGDIAGAAKGPGTYVDEVAWALVGGATSADLILYGTADFMNIVELARITIPEPMTMALLGLGSLFLLRRRK
jgi:hypothetical protein